MFAFWLPEKQTASSCMELNILFPRSSIYFLLYKHLVRVEEERIEMKERIYCKENCKRWHNCTCCVRPESHWKKKKEKKKQSKKPLRFLYFLFASSPDFPTQTLPLCINTISGLDSFSILALHSDNFSTANIMCRIYMDTNILNEHAIIHWSWFY